MNSLHISRIKFLLALGLVVSPLAQSLAHAADSVYVYRSYTPGVRAASTSPSPQTPIPHLEIQSESGVVASRLEFPVTQVGSNSAPRNILVVNKGDAALQFNPEPFSVTGYFSVSTHDCPGRLEPAASCSVSLVSSPAAGSAYSGILTVNSDATRGSNSITLEGIGSMDGVAEVVIGPGSANTFIRKTDGSWYAAGANSAEELGLPYSANGYKTFTKVPALTGATKVVAAAGTTFAKLSNGSWAAAGRNGYGQAGSGTLYGFTPISALNGAVEVVSAYQSTFAKFADGSWRATGLNDFGQLGLGDKNHRYGFTVVPQLQDATKVVSTQNATFAQMPNGDWMATGFNGAGALGLGASVTGTTTFTLVPSLTGATELIGGGSHVFAKLANGTWAATGANAQGQLGLGDLTARNVFTPVPSLVGATQVVAGDLHTLAKVGDSWVATGYNSYNQLGLGHNNNVYVFTVVPALSGALAVDAGSAFVFAQRQDGVWTSIGDNSYGQLGLNSTTSKVTSFTVLASFQN